MIEAAWRRRSVGSESGRSPVLPGEFESLINSTLTICSVISVIVKTDFVHLVHYAGVMR